MSRDVFGRDVPNDNSLSRSLGQVQSSYKGNTSERNNDNERSRRLPRRRNWSRSRSRSHDSFSRRMESSRRRRSRSPAGGYRDDFNTYSSRRQDRSSDIIDERNRINKSDTTKPISNQKQRREREDESSSTSSESKIIDKFKKTNEPKAKANSNLGITVLSSSPAKNDRLDINKDNEYEQKVDSKKEEEENPSNQQKDSKIKSSDLTSVNDIKSPEQKKKADEKFEQTLNKKNLEEKDEKKKKKKKKHRHKHKHSKREKKDDKRDSKSRRRSGSDKHERKRKKHRHRHRSSSSSSSSSDSSSSSLSLSSSSEQHSRYRDRHRRKHDKKSKDEKVEYQGSAKVSQAQSTLRGEEFQIKTEVDAPSSINKEDASKLLVLPPSTPGTGTILTVRDNVKGLATKFKSEIAAYDAIVIRVGTPNEEFRRIRFVLSDNSMSISQPFAKDLDAPTPFHIIRDPRRAQSLMVSNTSVTGASALKEAHHESALSSSATETMSREELLESRMKSKTDRMC